MKIAFTGKISENIKKEIYKRKLRSMALVIMAFIVLLGGVMLAFALRDGVISAENDGYVFDISVIMALSVLLVIWLLCAPYTRRQRETPWEFNVRINENNISVHNVTDNIRIRKETGKIRRVKDMGDYYLIYYAMLDSFIREKALITEGTVEEFESLFEGKIK